MRDILFDLTQRAGDMPEMGRGPQGPWRRIVDAIGIILPLQNLDTLGLVKVEKFKSGTNGDITPPSQKTGNTEPFRQVLPAMPCIKILATLGDNIMPDCQCPMTRQTHSHPPSTLDR